MLDFPAVRVGFVTQLLWERYGPFWRGLLLDAGAEAVFAEPEATREALGDERILSIPGISFRLAAAQAAALAAAGVDVLLLPELNAAAGEGAARGGAQDPWIAAFPATLRRTLYGIPTVAAVPVDVDATVEGRAVTLLQETFHDPTLVRRVWARHRAAARPPRRAAPRWTLRPSERRTVGVVGQPWLLEPGTVRRLAREGEHLVSQGELDPRVLRDEATRVDARLVPTDAEALGAARLFARRGGVAALRVLVDRTSGSDAWLVRRLEESVHKELEVVSLEDVLAGEDPVDSLLVTPVD